MSSDHANMPPDPSSSLEGVPPGGEPGVDPQASPSAPRRARGWIAALAAALLAGGAAWFVGERFLDYFAPSHAAAADPYSFGRLRKEKSEADARNAAIAYGALGAFLGLGLGLAGGLVRRSAWTGAAGALAGVFFGGAAGAGVSYLLVPYYLRTIDPAEPTLALPLMCHGAVWSAIGLAAGLAFGIGAGTPRGILPAAVGGTAGAVVGRFAFEVIQALALPTQRVEEFMGSTPAMRLAADVCLAVFVAAGAVALVTAPTRRRAKVAT